MVEELRSLGEVAEIEVAESNVSGRNLKRGALSLSISRVAIRDIPHRDVRSHLEFLSAPRIRGRGRGGVTSWVTDHVGR
jgi:hypothetical protein